MKQFFNEKEVTSTLVMDALYSGCKQIEEHSRQWMEVRLLAGGAKGRLFVGHARLFRQGILRQLPRCFGVTACVSSGGEWLAVRQNGRRGSAQYRSRCPRAPLPAPPPWALLSHSCATAPVTLGYSCQPFLYSG